MSDDIEIVGELTAEEMTALAMQRVAERRDEVKTAPRKPWEFTTHEYAEVIGKSETTARHKLAIEVKAGRMGSRWVTKPSGQPYKVYFDLEMEDGDE